MSASQEKKNRTALRSEGGDKKANAAAEKATKDKKFRRNAIIFAVIAVIVIAAAIVINSNVLYTGTTAVQIGDTKFSPAEVSCYYRMAYSSIYNTLYSNYGDMAQYILNPNTPLDEQQYSDTQTWADYLYDQTLDNMKQVTILCDEAERNGFALPEEAAQSVESNIAQLQMYALSGGYPNLDSFLVTNYGGKGMSEALYRKVSTRMALADAYATYLQESYTYTDAELESHYNEHADEFDVISYAYVTDYDGVIDAEAVAAAVKILASACKTISDIEPDRVWNSVLAIGALLAELVGSTKSAFDDGLCLKVITAPECCCIAVEYLLLIELRCVADTGNFIIELIDFNLDITSILLCQCIVSCLY